MKVSDQADILDAPRLNGFFARGRFYPYVMGGAPDGEGEPTDTDAGGDEDQDDTEVDNSDGKIFTQEEVNALIARESSKAKRGKVDPKELGFESAKELQEHLAEVKAKTDAEKTEEQKQREDELEAAKKEATDGILSTANARVLKAEFRIAAIDAGIPRDRLEDAYALSKLHEDWDPQVTEDGNVEGLTTEFFIALKEAKPYLFAVEGEDEDAGDIGAGARGNNGDQSNRQQELAAKYPAIAHLPQSASK